MSVGNVDAIQCLSKEVISVENMSKTLTQSVNELCLEREKNSISSTSFRRNFVLTSQVSADEVQNNERKKQIERNKSHKRKQLVRQKATTEDQLDNYRNKGTEHQEPHSQINEQYSSETGNSSRSASQLSNPNLSCTVVCDKGMTNPINKRKEEVPFDMINGYQSRTNSRTERIIYSERIDISPCSISSRDGIIGFFNKNQEQNGILKFKKQKTIESAPSRYGSARYLPKQYSAASSSSAFLSIHPSSSSNFESMTPKMTLVRGQSCSLVDIPTYLGSSVELGNLSEFNGVEAMIVKTPDRLLNIKQVSRENVMRLKLEILKHRNMEKPTRKTEWTLICIALAFLMICITLVGTMLSYTSDYQDRVVAKSMFYNDKIMLTEQNTTFEGKLFFNDQIET